MKKLNGIKRMPKATWIGRGEWVPVYALDQQRGSGIAYQSYAYAADGTPVHCGVTRHERMNRAVANQIHRLWLRWRSEYVQNNPGNYPTATAPIPTALVVFPVDNPEQKEVFYFGEAHNG